MLSHLEKLNWAKPVRHKRRRPARPAPAERLSMRIARKNKHHPKQISMRRVFVLPRRHGFMVAFSTLSIFAIALRLNNNILLLVAWGLFVVLLMSLIWAGRNLAGLKVILKPQQRLIAGTTQDLALCIANARGENRPRHRIVRKIGKTTTPINLKFTQTNLYARLSMTVRLNQRGRRAVPPLMLESDFPFGLTKCWAWVSPGEILVAPKPHPHPHSGRQAAINTRSRHQHAHPQNASFKRHAADRIAEYIPGTPQSRIHWKRFAATGRLVTKSGDEAAAGWVVLDYGAVQIHGHERALSMLCGAVLAAERDKTPFVLHLPDCQITSPTADAGEALDALALA